MASISIDLTTTARKMKPMHGGGQPPVISSGKDTFFHYLTEIGIPYSRLHDVNGAFGGGKYVDIHNIFRNFDADVNDPASYDFTFTDLLLDQLFKAGVEPYFRLGETIENAAEVKSYLVCAPTDIQKWAEICEHIVRHYTKGWADGHHYNITYWEIWGEPDNPPYLWNLEPEKYFELYEATAKLLKKCHPEIKVGAYGCTGFYKSALGEEPQKMEIYRIKFLRDFFNHLTATETPIDFFSWHCYGNTKLITAMDKWIANELTALGYGDLETHLNEWDPYAEEFGTGHHAAEMAAVMTSMQNGNPSVCCIYDMRIANAPYCPLFNPITFKPVQGYYVMAAFNTLYRLGNQATLSCDTEGLYALAATDGQHHALLLSNLTDNIQELCIEGVDLSRAKYHVIDNERLLSWSPAVKSIEKNQVVLVEW